LVRARRRRAFALLRRWNGRRIKAGTKGKQGKHHQHGGLLKMVGRSCRAGGTLGKKFSAHRYAVVCSFMVMVFMTRSVSDKIFRMR
jgi:hypothetical protein